MLIATENAAGCGPFIQAAPTSQGTCSVGSCTPRSLHPAQHGTRDPKGGCDEHTNAAKSARHNLARPYTCTAWQHEQALHMGK